MIKLPLQDGRYFASALDEAGAERLGNVSSPSCELENAGAGRLVGPRFMKEFVQAGDVAGLSVSVLGHVLQRSLVA